jgi:TPR repeat protein
MNNLGRCYRQGIGTSVDNKKAFELYQKAANLGNVSGINNLGYCYQNGIGTNIDNQKAFELYQIAANLDDVTSQFWLAFMYKIGKGTVRDIDQAIYWYKKPKTRSYNVHIELQNLLIIKEWFM